MLVVSTSWEMKNYEPYDVIEVNDDIINNKLLWFTKYLHDNFGDMQDADGNDYVITND